LVRAVQVFLKEITKNWDVVRAAALLLRALATSSWIKPPIASVSPLLDQNVRLQVRVSMIGLLTVAPANTKVESPTLLLISGFTFQSDKVILVDAGVTIRVLPNFLSWNPPKTAVAVCSLKFNCGTGWARLISIFACKIIGGDNARVGEKFRIRILISGSAR